MKTNEEKSAAAVSTASRVWTALVRAVFTAQAALLAPAAWAGELRVDHVFMPDAPAWLSPDRVTAVVNHVTEFMSARPEEVTVLWHSTTAAFRGAYPIPAWALAYHVGQTNTIHLGPAVSSGNFEHIFGHELTHAIVFQHYSDAVPKWLEEGLANYVGGGHPVDYRWLATQPRVRARSLVHDSVAGGDARFNYMTSTAIIEMLASRCSLPDLLLYSKGNDLESNLAGRCGVTDLDGDYGRWLAQKSRPAVAFATSTEKPAAAKAKSKTRRSSKQAVRGQSAAPVPTPIREGGAQAVDFGVAH